MIAKKNSGVNLERKRIAFFNIGLLGVGSLVLAAFTYQAPLEHEKEMAEVKPSEINYIEEYVKPKEEPIVIKKQKVEKPQDEPQTQPSLGDPNKVSADSKMVDDSQTSVDATVVISGPPGDDLEGDDIGPLADETGLVGFPSVPASFIGGVAEMKKFLMDEIVYPELEQSEGVSRKVYVYFVVEKDGSISNVKIENPEGDGLDREAKRVVRKFPKWIPAENKGKKVRTYLVIPINFDLVN